MTEKRFNEEWMAEMLNSKDTAKDYSGNLPDIDWVSYNKGFKKSILFKVMPANTKENDIFSYKVATHWIDFGGQKKRFVCPEQTSHLKKSGIKCPVCEMHRKLKSMGFTEDQLSVQGKFGPVSVFEPTIKSQCKVVVLESDTKSDWDRAHISILQQNGDYPTIWLAQKYQDKTIPNFTDIVSSNPISMTRPKDSGSWNREFSFALFTPPMEVAERLRDENEALTLPDLWKLPSDQEILEMRQLMSDMEQSYVSAREAMNTSDDSIDPVVVDDDIPF